MTEQPSTPDRIIVTGHFSGFAPEELFDYWTKPELLIQWWPQVAELDLRVGGEYHFAWPQMDWHLRGLYTKIEPGANLGFTWQWDHGKQGEPLQVTVAIAPDAAGGSDMTVEHWPFAADDQDDRQGIVEGWIHFGMRLAGLRDGTG